ncbi:MAG: EamA family transporter RarD [Candidatus Nanopelagicales bacterium]
MSEQQRGLAFGLAAYLLWGLFPLYYPLLEPAGPVEILANRIVWSLVVVTLLLAVRRRWRWLRPLLKNRRQMLLLSAAAIAIALNWGFYVYGVNSNQVIETSLGYFVNPLVSVMFGVVLFHERLRRWQWAAVCIGVLAVAVIAIDYGRLPWIALVLAFSFGTYGMLKKTIDMGSLESLSVETAVLFLPAIGFLLLLNFQGTSTLQEQGAQHAALLATTGLVTVAPLLFFGAAATRIPLTWIGLLQYTAPVIQFLIGVVVYNESMPASRWVGFSLVWLALVILAFDSVAAVKRGRASDPANNEVVCAEAH